MDSLGENDGNTSEFRLNCKGGLHNFAVYFWHSEGSPARKGSVGSVILRNRDTPHPWLMVGDANMDQTLVRAESGSKNEL